MPSQEANALERKTAQYVRRILGDEVEILSQARNLPGTPDIYVPEMRLAIFCDGVFWHDESYRMTRTAVRMLARGHKARSDFWAEKARLNRERDRRVNRELRAMGIQVVRLKENRLQGRDPLSYVSRSIALVTLRPIRERARSQAAERGAGVRAGYNS